MGPTQSIPLFVPGFALEAHHDVMQSGLATQLMITFGLKCHLIRIGTSS